MGQIAKAASQPQQQSQVQLFKAQLELQWPRMAAVLPKHVSPERMYQLAMSCYNQTPELAECSTASILSCVMRCSSLGLEPSAVDGLGKAYILPYYNKKTGRKEAQVIIGYRGMLDLVRRSGEVLDVYAHAVYEGDEFAYQLGLHKDLVHVPSPASKKDRRLTFVYMVAELKGGGTHFEVMSRDEIDDVRRASKGGEYGPWRDNFEEMAKKTVLRRAFKMLPSSTEVAQAVASDETTPRFVDSDGVILGLPDGDGEGEYEVPDEGADRQ